MEQAAKTKKLLSVFMRRLTNLSANNKSLFLPRLFDQFVDLYSLSQLNGENAFSIIEALIDGKKKNICPISDSRMANSNSASLKLKKLKRTADFIFEERGSEDLHVGWPFIHGKFSDGTFVRAPLLFFPVTLVVDQNHWSLLPRKDADLSLNKSFLLGYSFFNKVPLVEKLMEETFEDFPSDTIAFRTDLYRLFQTTLDLHFDPTNYYQNDLTSFINFTKDEFDSKLGDGELKVVPEAVIGIFPQAGSSLVPDYGHLIEENSFQDLEEFFYKKENNSRGTKNFIPLVKEDKVYTAFPTDSWQENALKAVKLGNSIVVEGPPGTGKSQLICNLVSDSIANGKRVLVVSQKRAALDVVYKRLSEKKLEEFCALVHDFKNDRKNIFEKLARQINRTDEYKSKNIALDSIQLDRAFFQASHQIDHLTEELEHFRSTLFDESECGESVKNLYLWSDPTQDSISIKQEYHHFKFDALDDFLRKMNLYVRLAAMLESDHHPWNRRKSFARLMPSELTRIERMIEDVVKVTAEATETARATFGVPCDWHDFTSLLSNQSEIEIVSQLIKSEELLTYVQKILQAPQEVSSLWLSNIERMVMDCFAGDGPEISVAADQLGQFQKALYRSMKARRSLLGLIRWQLFSKDKVLITRVLVANKLNNDKLGFRQLEQMLDTRLNLEHNFSKLKNSPWIKSSPESLDLSEIKSWFLKQQAAIRAAEAYQSIRAFKKVVDPLKNDFQKFISQIQNLLEWLPSLQSKFTEWQTYLTPVQILELSNDPKLGMKLTQSLKKDYDILCEFDLQEESLTQPERAVVTKLHELTRNWSSEEFKKIFLNSLRLAWIDHIEVKHPELRMVSSGKIQMVEEELRERIVTKENLSTEILLLRARERITENLEFNRLNNQVTYRDLLHQVTKKKKIWPLRKVLTDFEDEIFKLAPCWLASPESVSALFPMREIFDLVIFDEASQCFAERGIPALYRGKQAVIAGDSKQLRPGDFYLARWQEEDFDEPDAEVDSLLDLSGRHLLKMPLNEHYRSRSEQLIHFSNKHFYDNRLSVVPGFEFVKENISSITYLNVNGTWENNCNKMEAREVIHQIKSIKETTPGKEIGVVTFNIQQQYLIQDMLEQETISETSRLFIKNIENVQGDECDILIFSIGYAPDKTGKLNAQFGSLNQDGGENRLNVAVTRAREKIIIVSSILPNQLQVEDTKNQGPKLLKEYLSYALSISSPQKLKEIISENQQAQASDLRNLITKRNSNPDVSYSLAGSFADVIMSRNGKTAGVLITDDRNYFESLSCKEAHAHLPRLLEERKWPYARVYSRGLWADQKRFFSDIENSL